jgi:xanthine dehydrogenase small subunit
MTVRFLLDGDIVTLTDVDPTATLVDHLRYAMKRTGTKVGCAEGDCGACTVLVGEPNAAGDTVDWRAVNSCIQFLPMLDGKAVMTVESLGTPDTLTPLQTSMAANGSSQCGFCTPGFIMALHGRSIGARGHTLPVADVLAGNLCRCTGYGPILAAARDAPPVTTDDTGLLSALRAIAPTETTGGTHATRRWFAPATSDALATLLVEHPDARIVAGATDVALWVTKGLQTIETLVFVGDIPDLRVIEESEAGVRIGAAVRYADAHAPLARLHPDFGELVRRFAGLQVRNAGTIGGNIANGSPIGDGPPALIALGATLTLRSIRGRRTMPMEAFFLDYGKQDRAPDEFVESIWIPRPPAEDVIHMSKLSRRFDSDISAVCGAFKLTLNDGRITAARVAFGGMAATPRRAPACEAALIGEAFDKATIDRASVALGQDYTPLNDVRGTAAYRTEAAANLLQRLWHRAAGDPVSLMDLEVTDGRP